jgi:cytidyltransferase-like protein
MIRVFVSGTFDLVHPGHLEFLEQAALEGDQLIVSVASDATIRALKREPVWGEHDRWRMISALRCVTRAFISRGSPTWADCLSYVRTERPDLWVIAADDPFLAEKRREAEALGIEVRLNYRPEAGLSTTRLIETIQARRPQPFELGAATCPPLR